jgi:hypothetical protein
MEGRIPDGLGLSAVFLVIYVSSSPRIVTAGEFFFTINFPVFLATQYNQQHNSDVTRVTEKSLLSLSGRIYPIKVTEALLILLLVAEQGSSSISSPVLQHRGTSFRLPSNQIICTCIINISKLCECLTAWTSFTAQNSKIYFCSNIEIYCKPIHE